MNKHIKIISIGVRTGKLLSQFPIKDRNKNQILNVVPKSGEKRNFFHPYCMEKFNSYDIKLSDEGSVFYEVRPSSKDLLTLDGFLYGVRWLILLVQITTWETLQQAVFIANMAQNMSIPTRLIVCRSIYHANFTESCIEDKSCNLFAELAQRSLVVRYFEEAFETYIDYEEENDFLMDTQGEIEECLQEQIDKGEKYIISNQEPLKESNL